MVDLGLSLGSVRRKGRVVYPADVIAGGDRIAQCTVWIGSEMEDKEC